MVWEYIYLATGCVVVGVVLTFAVLGLVQKFGISTDDHIWVVAIPAVLSLVLNVSLLEIYRKWRRNKKTG